MLFEKNLEEIIFNRHNLVHSDELVIISGYLGPNPVARLATLPFKTTVIYGMYGSEKIKKKLHESLLRLVNEKVNILYSNIPIHSKCYVWKRKDEIVHALVGSANFSTNGLTTPYREVLAETTVDTFDPLNTYIKKIIENSISCDEHVSVVDIIPISTGVSSVILENPDICEMTLLDTRTNDVPNGSGINWGHGTGNTGPNDAYITIRAEHIRNYPQLFPPIPENPIEYYANGRPKKNFDAIDIIWDDGYTMNGRFGQTGPKINGKQYPKAIHSIINSDLGSYLRKRMGLRSGIFVTKDDLEKYGRTSINISLQSEGVYYFDFSV